MACAVAQQRAVCAHGLMGFTSTTTTTAETEDEEVAWLAPEGIFVGQVDREKYILGERREVTIDSAAEESVCPKDWESEFGLKHVSEDRKLKLVSANGGRIEHFGEREVSFQAEDAKEGGMMGMIFQVSDVRKPLAAVWRICQKGNRVCFGPEEGDNFIENKKTGRKVGLRKKGGSYILKVQVVKKRNEGETFTGRV